ncbi:MAG: hypothetical protein H5T66_15835, partial [Chloroflexi bacterium]|nr:hypothetical protein [Chloroflexota bacterium]
VRFAKSTERNGQYTIQVRYTVDRSVFEATTYNGQPYRAIGWAPFEWALPIVRQEIRYILPVELPAHITQPEQVTEGIVQATGLVVNNANAFDRWVYFPTPDEKTGKVWLSIFVAKNNLPPETSMVPQFFLPASAITTTRETPIPLYTPTPQATPRPVDLIGTVREMLNSPITCCTGI